jgi:hypothetical protein
LQGYEVSVSFEGQGLFRTDRPLGGVDGRDKPGHDGWIGFNLGN